MSNIQISSPPQFKHLNGQTAHLEVLRSSVAPILSNRILTQFTDHSVSHSDNVARLIDELIESIQISKQSLTQQELTILYATCYLHDIGMHYENAGNTEIIRSVNLKTAWEDLPEKEKRELLRKYHHQISAEMIMNSVRAENPIVGLQLTQSYYPELVASLSEAHNLSVDTERYRELTTDVGNVRMGLLSGIFRISDILDESRRRATLEQARTLQLDLTSQTHWWRHYFTEDVRIDQNQRLVTIWFDFPKERFSEYNSVVPQLQMPWIEAEFNHHSSIFHKYEFGWSVTHVSPNKPYSSAANMPDIVLSEMWKQITNRRKQEDEERRNETLRHFRRSMPYFDRKLTELETIKTNASPEEYLIKVAEVANDLWDIGGKRRASQLLSGAFSENAVKALPPKEKLRIGLQLAKMFNTDKESRRALQILSELKTEIMELSDETNLKFKFYQMFARTLANLCGFEEAKQAYAIAIDIAPNEFLKEELIAELTEMCLLFGDLEGILSSVKEAKN